MNTPTPEEQLLDPTVQRNMQMRILVHKREMLAKLRKKNSKPAKKLTADIIALEDLLGIHKQPADIVPDDIRQKIEQQNPQYSWKKYAEEHTKMSD